MRGEKFADSIRFASDFRRAKFSKSAISHARPRAFALFRRYRAAPQTVQSRWRTRRGERRAGSKELGTGRIGRHVQWCRSSHLRLVEPSCVLSLGDPSPNSPVAWTAPRTREEPGMAIEIPARRNAARRRRQRHASAREGRTCARESTIERRSTRTRRHRQRETRTRQRAAPARMEWFGRGSMHGYVRSPTARIAVAQWERGIAVPRGVHFRPVHGAGTPRVPGLAEVSFFTFELHSPCQKSFLPLFFFPPNVYRASSAEDITAVFEFTVLSPF